MQKQHYFKYENPCNFWFVDPIDLKLEPRLVHDLKNLFPPKILKELNRIRIFWFVKLCCTKIGSKPKNRLTLNTKLQITWNLAWTLSRMSGTYSNHRLRKSLPKLWHFPVWGKVAQKQGKNRRWWIWLARRWMMAKMALNMFPHITASKNTKEIEAKTTESRNHSETPKRAKTRFLHELAIKVPR